MTAHTHSAVVPGCFRCELGADEVRNPWAWQDVAEFIASEVSVPVPTELIEMQAVELVEFMEARGWQIVRGSNGSTSEVRP